MTRKTEKRIGGILSALLSVLLAWAIYDGTMDYARDHDGVEDPAPTCYRAEDGTSLCVEP